MVFEMLLTQSQGGIKMRFLITQTHEPEDCLKDIGGFRKAFRNENVKGIILANVYTEHGLPRIPYLNTVRLSSRRSLSTVEGHVCPLTPFAEYGLSKSNLY